eukprot:COSAG03_NODE_9980_length_680_cov_1.304647_1_plen_194_part_10
MVRHAYGPGGSLRRGPVQLLAMLLLRTGLGVAGPPCNCNALTNTTNNLLSGNVSDWRIATNQSTSALPGSTDPMLSDPAVGYVGCLLGTAKLSAVAAADAPPSGGGAISIEVPGLAYQPLNGLPQESQGATGISVWVRGDGSENFGCIALSGCITTLGAARSDSDMCPGSNNNHGGRYSAVGLGASLTLDTEYV